MSAVAEATKESAAPTQPLEAMALANKIRIAHRDIVRMLSRSELSLEQVFAIEEAGSLNLERALEALPTQRKMPKPGVPRRSIAAAEKILDRACVAGERPISSFRCDRIINEILAAAYDVVGRFAWIYTEDPAPELEPWKPAKRGPEYEGIYERARLKANETRVRRKEMKAMLRSGEMTLAEVLADPHSQTWAIGSIVEQLPIVDCGTGEIRDRRGPAKALRALKRAGVAATHKVERFEAYELESLVSLMEAAMLTAESGRRADRK